MLGVESGLPWPIWVVLIVLCLVAGFGLGYFIRLKSHEKSFVKTKQVSEKIIADEFDHWGFRKGEYGPIDSAVSSSDIRIIIDPASGKPILQLVGNVGDKWVSNFVIWEMIYEDGAWKVISFANMDETYYN